MTQLILTPLAPFPLVKPTDDLAKLINNALQENNIQSQSGDILVIAQKIISKVEGRTVILNNVTPSSHALEIASQTGKDPRLVELILSESNSISRIRPGLIITRHKLGFTSANSGIDRSNVSQQNELDETVLLLPENPDQSAAQIRDALYERTGIFFGIVINDSHGRPFRFGTVGMALGVAGIPALWDRRGEPDLFGFALQHTEVGIGDEIAAAASLLMGQANEGTPVIHIRGLTLTAPPGTASDLIRPPHLDLYQ